MKASIQEIKNPQTQITKQLLKQAINEFFQENPEIIQEIIKKEFEGIKESIELLLIGQAADRKRLADIELLLGLEETLQDPESPFYEAKKERYHQLFLDSVFSNKTQTAENENVKNLLYSELQKTLSMRNKDVLNFLGWDKKATMKATRLMQRMPKTYPDVVCDYAPGQRRTLRIYIKT